PGGDPHLRPRRGVPRRGDAAVQPDPAAAVDPDDHVPRVVSQLPDQRQLDRAEPGVHLRDLRRAGRHVPRVGGDRARELPDPQRGDVRGDPSVCVVHQPRARAPHGRRQLHASRRPGVRRVRRRARVFVRFELRTRPVARAGVTGPSPPDLPASGEETWIRSYWFVPSRPPRKRGGDVDPELLVPPLPTSPQAGRRRGSGVTGSSPPDLPASGEETSRYMPRKAFWTSAELSRSLPEPDCTMLPVSST